jgi:hypothetical protein
MSLTEKGMYEPLQIANLARLSEASMLARPTLTRPAQARPTEERFLLKVDGQIKRSFSSKETAATAGAAIKKAYPLVVVTVVDKDEHTTEIINV